MFRESDLILRPKRRLTWRSIITALKTSSRHRSSSEDHNGTGLIRGLREYLEPDREKAELGWI